MFKFWKRNIKPDKPITIQDRIKGVVYGHAIGDAIGLGTEFLDKRQIKIFYPKGFSNYDEIISDKHRSRWKKGEWTDDTDQMLCILESILAKQSADEIDVAKRIREWAYAGGRGLGNTVYNVITTPNFVQNPHNVSKQIWIKSGSNNAANGAVMRTSVLGIWNFNDLQKVKENTENIAKITHYDPRCIGSCVAVTTAIAKFLQNENDISKIVDLAIQFSTIYDDKIHEYLDFSGNRKITTLQLDESKSIGYTFKALGAGFWALQQNDYKKAILEIVNQGGDADTNGAVAGGLLGAKFGFSGLPQDWIDGLQNKYKLDHLINKLIGLMIDNKQINDN